MIDGFPHGHALVIGVGEDLPYTVNDAEGFAMLLSDPNRGGYQPSQVHLLLDKAATKQAVEQELKALREVTTVDSTIIIYFSGHGVLSTYNQQQYYYLCTYGYDPRNLAKTGISSTDLIAALNVLPARRILLIFDCCHAGGFGPVDYPNLGITNQPYPPEIKNLNNTNSNILTIASSRHNELSETGIPYSAFTYALLEGMTGRAATNHDGNISALEIAEYTARRVPELTKDLQHPIHNIRKEVDFPISYYSRNVVLSVDPFRIHRDSTSIPFQPLSIEKFRLIRRSEYLTESLDDLLLVRQTMPNTYPTFDIGVTNNNDTSIYISGIQVEVLSYQPNVSEGEKTISKITIVLKDDISDQDLTTLLNTFQLSLERRYKELCIVKPLSTFTTKQFDNLRESPIIRSIEETAPGEGYSAIHPSAQLEGEDYLSSTKTVTEIAADLEVPGHGVDRFTLTLKFRDPGLYKVKCSVLCGSKASITLPIILVSYFGQAR